MDAREFAQWIAWTHLHGPITPERGDIRAAQVSSWISAMAAAWGGGKPASIDDLQLQWGPGSDEKRAGAPEANHERPDEMASWASALLMIERNRLQAERDRVAKAQQDRAARVDAQHGR